MIQFFSEFLLFVRTRKKFWLTPLLVMMLVFGGLIVLTKGTVMSPFIYALF
jgi:hypothetical protein